MTISAHLPLGEMTPVDLATVLEVAALQRRVDRKYLVPAADAARLVRDLTGTHHVLQVAGRRSTTYRSTYLDTADLRLCRDHIQGRRLRWKARSRLYVEDQLCRFEVKVKGPRGETVKHAIDRTPDEYGVVGTVERDFVSQVLGEAHPAVAHLHPVLEVAYARATLVDLTGASRLTIDHGVTGRRLTGATSLHRGAVVFDDDRVIVETKSGPRPGEGDRLLAEMGHRAVTLSKYTTSATLLARSVPDNDVRHLVGRGVTVHLETPREIA